MDSAKWKGKGKSKKQEAALAKADATDLKALEAEVKGAAAAAPAAEKFVSTTPAGQLKDLGSMRDTYWPAAVEDSWDAWWEQQGLYKPREEKCKPEDMFVIVIPPPNVTGNLHIGHALTISIEDTLVRWNRMCGKNTLYLPGTDHAGIATQAVVEKKLAREQKLSRHDIGREAFLKEVWKYKEEYGGTINRQLRRMGASVDWSRERFTMDDVSNRAVTEAFVRMFGDGLISRGNRLVNWSCALRTALSTVECEPIDLPGPTKLKVPGYTEEVEFGVLHHFAYEFADGSGSIVVATTRLETMLGDVAVAVHPKDPRYAGVHGKELKHPFIPDRKVVVITDEELVDMSFGTGAVKITPAHDPNDFKCGQKHGLAFINIFDDSGCINENGGAYKGMPRFQARVKVQEDLQKLGLWKEKTPNPMKLAKCQRSGDIIEPVIRPQWWVNCQSMAARAVNEVRTGALKILPEQHTDTWYRWLENVQDWCVSRQLWWGHRIPAWFVEVEGQPMPADDSNEHWVVAHNEEEARAIAEKKYGTSKLRLHQDPDVLDTWFSSGLFPFSTMQWPDEKHPDFGHFYPGTLLETGHDILFFWVARMVMMGLHLTDKLPFHTVYLHSMVRDKLGRKMSKSKGNVIDPLDIIHGIPLQDLLGKLLTGNLDPLEAKVSIEGHKKDFPQGIPECGADALRFGLLSYLSQGRDINLDINRVIAWRQFGNKLWNVLKFALTNFPADYKPPQTVAEVSGHVSKAGRFADRWILSRLAHCVAEANRGFREYDFAAAATAVHQFWLYELCDYYLEMIKRVMYFDRESADGKKPEVPAEERDRLEAERASARAVLYWCLDWGLKLLHPMMPYLSEELFQRLPGKDAIRAAAAADPKAPHPSLMVQRYPQPSECAAWSSAEVEADMDVLQAIARTSRSSRVSLGLTSKRVPIFVSCAKPEELRAVSGTVPDLTTIAFAQSVTPLDRSRGDSPPEGCMSAPISPDLSIHIPLKGLVDLSAEIIKMEKQQRTLQGAVDGFNKTMSAPGYADRTKPEVQADHKARMETAQKQLAEVTASIADFVAILSPEQKKQYQTTKLNSLKADLAKLEKDVNKSLPKDVAVGVKLSKKATQAVEGAIPSMRTLEETLAKLSLEVGVDAPPADSLPSAKYAAILDASNAAAAAGAGAGAGASS